MGLANAERSLDYIRIIVEFISQVSIIPRLHFARRHMRPRK